MRSLCWPGLEDAGGESKSLDSKRRLVPSGWDDANLIDPNDERRRWNRKYGEAPKERIGTWGTTHPDPFLMRAFSQYILPLYAEGGSALDLAGGAGRHAIWLAKQGWQVTLIDISETGVELARQSAGPLSSHISFVIDDLTHFKASQTRGLELALEPASEPGAASGAGPGFDVVMVFFYLERDIFPEMVKAIRPGGFLMYKTYTSGQAKLADGPKDRAHLLERGELAQLAAGLEILHYREEIEKNATAEVVARKLPPAQLGN